MPDRRDRHRTALEHLDRYAWVLDSAFRLPGGFRIGLDGIIGLLPGLGDAVSGLLAAYIVFAAYKVGASRSVLTRMCTNILIDTLIGSIPIFGDIFDVAFKSNLRNASLLRRYMENPSSTHRRSRGVLALYALVAIATIIVAVGLPVFLLVQLARALAPGS